MCVSAAWFRFVDGCRAASDKAGWAWIWLLVELGRDKMILIYNKLSEEQTSVQISWLFMFLNMNKIDQLESYIWIHITINIAFIVFYCTMLYSCSYFHPVMFVFIVNYSDEYTM